MTDETVVPLRLAPHTINNIPECMEQVVANLRAGDYGEIASGSLVLVNSDGIPIVFGWGPGDDLSSIGLLTLGASWLATHRTRRG